jgi:sugar/nucleoside kinase (ribokinase family)
VLLQALGPKIVVMMDGEEGSFVLDKTTLYHLPATTCEVVEKTGAGDSWTSGFLASVVLGNDIPTSMRWGNANAVSVIGRVGAQAGLLTKDMLEQTYTKMPEVEVQTL